MLNLLEDDGTSLSPKNDREFIPQATNGAALGSATVMWSDLFLAEGGIINFNNGNQTITHSLGTLTTNGDLAIAGALSGVTTLGMSGVLTTAGAIDITIADEGNDVGLTVTQNDVTNNPIAANITNAGTGNSLFINHNNSGIMINANQDVSTHTGNLNWDTINVVRTNTASSTSTNTGSVMKLENKAALSDTATDTTKVLEIVQDGDSTGRAIDIINYGTGEGIKIDQNSNAR